MSGINFDKEKVSHCFEKSKIDELDDIEVNNP